MIQANTVITGDSLTVLRDMEAASRPHRAVRGRAPAV